jgi:hypothetical protein
VTPRLELKRPTGWFAAGREMEEALGLLSDSAFRLFVWICLRAGRHTGALQVDAAQLARVLHKRPDELLHDMNELVDRRVCSLTGHRVLVQDRFWPYQRADTAVDRASSYVAAIQRAFLGHACVVGAFSAADEKLAREWERRSIPVETVEHAIALGVARKYIAWLNHGVGTPITSLEYFAGIVSEVEQAPAGPEYWTHVARKARNLEADYQALQQRANTPAGKETK